MNMRTMVATVVAVVVGVLGTYLKCSIAFGSKTAFFSAISVLLPVIGLFGGLGSTFLFLLSKLVLRTAIHGLPIFGGTTFYLPSWCAAWSISSPKNHYIWYVVPLACMVLFIVHPIGGQAWLYSAYWFIPIVIARHAHNSLFARALGSTFIAHAVGSIIWLYTVPMTVAQWISLIPVVAVERVTYASGIVVVYYAIQWFSHVLSCFVYKKQIVAQSAISIVNRSQ